MIQYTNRSFFNNKKNKESDKAVSEEKEKNEDAAQPKEAQESKKEKDSDGESADELSKSDIKKIKALFSEQEVEIESLKKALDDERAKLKKNDLEMTAFRIEYTKQVRENEDTVKRYRKMIEDEKQFAITKFAKDLLEVRDAVRFALENTDKDALMKETDLQALKEKFAANLEG